MHCAPMLRTSSTVFLQKASAVRQKQLDISQQLIAMEIFEYRTSISHIDKAVPGSTLELNLVAISRTSEGDIRVNFSIDFLEM